MPTVLLVVIAIALLHCANALMVNGRGHVRLRFARQLTDHATLTWPYNALVYLFSRVPNRPFLPSETVPSLSRLEAAWERIRDEGLRLLEIDAIHAATGDNDVGFANFYRRGWKRFYLAWYGERLPSAERLCPETTRLLREIPEVRGAMFAWLPAGGRLGRHRDPFAGSLRYHLGLATPNDDRCWIEVDTARYSWRDGAGVLFDETFVHRVENGTDQPRLILFCDVERPLREPMHSINQLVMRVVMRATATQNEAGERIGLINRIASPFLALHRLSRGLKAEDRARYYRIKRLAAVGVALTGLAALAALAAV